MFCATALTALVLVDWKIYPIPFVRALRVKISVTIASFVAVAILLFFTRKRMKPEDEQVGPNVDVFDDTDERETDESADNTDIQASATDNDLDDLDDRIGDRDERLAGFRSDIEDL
jgi:hypothetical protein